MSFSFMYRYYVLFFAALSVLTQAACKHAPPANVAAMVNGHPITYTELEKTYQSQYPQQPEAANQDLVMSQKLELLGNLITNEILLQRAEKLGLTAVDADVDTELNKMKAPYTKEEFDKQIADRHMALDDLKTQIRQRLTVDKLVNKEITSHVTITDADVANFYNANKANFNLKEPQVHMAQILVTPTPDPNVHNLKNSKARNESEAKSKIEDIEARLNRGEDFALLAQNYSEDPQSAPNGGDMGFITESALERANPELRNMVMSMTPNGVSRIIHTQDGYRILRVISREPSGQRDLNDPRVQQNIRETLLNAKDQLLKTAYYETARNGAKIENYLARSILDSAGR
jgi:peptidyl-prolyl cis-trans isomerase SurA